MQQISAFGDHPDGMNDAGDIAEQGQENIQPESPSKTDLEENSQWWQEDSDQNSYQIHALLLYRVFVEWLPSESTLLLIFMRTRGL